ncbi:MAG: hypothetical protein ACP5RQ_01375 [Candidatus Micrarchaeia archaeon]
MLRKGNKEREKKIEVVYFSLNKNSPFYNNDNPLEVKSVKEASEKADDLIDGFWLIKRDKDKNKIYETRYFINGTIKEIGNNKEYEKLSEEGIKRVVITRNGFTEPFFDSDKLIRRKLLRGDID